MGGRKRNPEVGTWGDTVRKKVEVAAICLFYKLCMIIYAHGSTLAMVCFFGFAMIADLLICFLYPRE